MGNGQGRDDDRVLGEREVPHPPFKCRAAEGHDHPEVDQFGEQRAQGGPGIFQVIDPGGAE